MGLCFYSLHRIHGNFSNNCMACKNQIFFLRGENIDFWEWLQLLYRLWSLSMCPLWYLQPSLRFSRLLVFHCLVVVTCSPGWSPAPLDQSTTTPREDKPSRTCLRIPKQKYITGAKGCQKQHQHLSDNYWIVGSSQIGEREVVKQGHKGRQMIVSFLSLVASGAR